MRDKFIRYTIRGVPDSVDLELRRRAREQSKSLNQVVIEALATGLGVKADSEEPHYLDFLAGSWVPDVETEAILEEQRRIDLEMWR